MSTMTLYPFYDLHSEPVCGVRGYLEKHRRRYRIRHYLGYKEGRRIYEYHYVTRKQLEDQSGINGYKQLGINKPILNSIRVKKGSGSIVRSSMAASRAADPGSNPGRSTI